MRKQHHLVYGIRHRAVVLDAVVDPFTETISPDAIFAPFAKVFPNYFRIVSGSNRRREE